MNPGIILFVALSAAPLLIAVGVFHALVRLPGQALRAAAWFLGVVTGLPTKDTK